MRSSRDNFLLAACALAIGCAGPPDDACQARPDEGSVAIDCPQPEDEWSDRAADEALEGFEERSPGGRP